MAPKLNEEQTDALQYVSEGHNLLLMGQAGTGKSFVVRRIFESLKNDKKVCITATTGIACTHYTQAQTIHRWSGIGDGRVSTQDLKEHILNNRHYTEVKSRIMETDILVIDECSMLSRKLFDSLNEICKIKNSKIQFGGIQVVLVGDFVQLPPVPNVLYGDEGDFCFKSEAFDQVFPHRILLKNVVRQSELHLLQAISECAMGKNVSNETAKFLDSLKRPLPETSRTEATRLFSTNDMVDDFNRNSVLKHVGQLYEFTSSDNGEKRYLNSIPVPKTLWLKLGVPVILMRNISDRLVNGLRGHVSKITANGPVVVFDEKEVPIPKMKCTVFDPQKNMNVAEREQYPIKLAFALSIHKSQGMTLNSVEINCKGMFKPGQLGVAIGRCRNSDGLRVVNFAPHVCMPQPKDVQDFLNDLQSLARLDDRSCCKVSSLDKRPTELTNVPVDELLAAEIDTDLDENEIVCDYFDSEFDSIIENIDEIQNQSPDLPDGLDLEKMLQDIHCENVVTSLQYNTNKILGEIDRNKFNTFAKNVYQKLRLLAEAFNIDSGHTGPVSAQKLSEFYGEVNKYQGSAEYTMNRLSLFENSTFTEEHMHICYKVTTVLRKYLLKQKVETMEHTKGVTSKRTVTNASHARIRYVGGYCVAKVNYKYMEKKKSSRYKTDKDSQTTYAEAVCCVNILEGLRIQEQHITSITTEPESLLDVSRRQNTNKSLTNISDALFKFFCLLAEICLNLLVDENLNRSGENIFESAKTEILNSTELNTSFREVVKKNEVTSSDLNEDPVDGDDLEKHMNIIYAKIIKVFLMVMFNQFRKDILETYQIKKKMSHRKQILVSEKKVTKQTADNITPGPSKTNKRKKKTAENVNQSVKDIQSGTSQSVSSKRQKSQELIQDNTTDPGTAHTDSDSSSDLCIQCSKGDKMIKGVTDDWIQCDSCDKWTHRSCAGLTHHMKWKAATKATRVFHCKQCE